ncbi:MAG TPA: two-component regulator propeller domain-containing protein [Verrucomicrobiota bacterium]|nr:two-component regulator propeller domain-containing protein [Verrucomicrobiota bacterium]HNU51694.1 two-component regulator propeller domain-containing protein [Verrucomicrobiota bacterium]
MASSTRNWRITMSAGLAAISMHGLVAVHAASTTAGAECPYVIRTWRMEDGLPENRIRSVCQTQEGHLWIGTFNGLARFDGVNFRVFDTVKTPELRDCAIRALFEDSRGTLWLGHHNGQLTTYRHGRFSPRPLPPRWPNLEVDSFAEDRAGAVWVMNRGGWLARFQEDGVATLVAPQTERLVNHLHVDTGGQLWMHRDFQVLPLTPNGTAIEEPARCIAGRTSLVACASRTGGVWVADSGLRRWHQGQWAEDRGALPWQDPGLTALLETSGGDLWLGTYTKGVYVATRTGQQHQVNVDHGLSHNTVSSLWEDREGNVWVGTGGGGLNMLRRKRVQMVTPPDRWQHHPVLCVTTNQTGGLWVGTEGAGVYAYDGRNWRTYDDRHGIARRDAWSIHEDLHGRLWVGSAWNGVLVRDGERFIPAPGWPEQAWIIYALHGDAAGGLWAGAERGVGRLRASPSVTRPGSFAPSASHPMYEGARRTGEDHTRLQPDDSLLHRDAWQIIDLDPAIIEERVRQIAEDASGAVWFATAGNGLWRLLDDRITHYGPQQGLASEYLTCLWVDPDQALWIGTKGGGLWRLRNGQFAAVTTRQGLPGETVVSITDDQTGHLWLATSRGLVRVNQAQLNQCADGQSGPLDCLQLDLTDGLTSLEFEGPNQPNACRTPDGRLWFATGTGLAMVDPEALHTNRLAPPVVIESLSVDGHALSLPEASNAASRTPPPTPAPHQPSRTIPIPPGRHRLEIHYAGLSYAAPHRMRFRHRLEGIEDQWNDVGNARTAYYSYLPPGSYTFRVVACNNDGVWNEVGAALSIRQLPHYWQTWWFRAGSSAGGAALVALAVAAVVRRRHRRKLEVLERQRAVERERIRIAQDIHDDLGAHLTRISLLSESALGKLTNEAPAASDLRRIQTTAHDVTCALDEIVWAVNPRHDTLNSLVNYLTNYAEEHLEAAGVRMRLDLPVALPAWPLTVEVRHNLFLATKEALHNVMKHAAATEVRLFLQLTAEGFTLELEDNGRGFAAATDGNGLWSMKKRLEDVGGNCEIHGAPGHGTRVRFSVRVQSAARPLVAAPDMLSSEQTIPRTTRN